METTTTPQPSNNGINGATTDDMMKVLVRQHRVINSLKDQLASVLLGLAETQATVDELREDLAAAQAEQEAGRPAPPQPMPVQQQPVPVPPPTAE